MLDRIRMTSSDVSRPSSVDPRMTWIGRQLTPAPMSRGIVSVDDARSCSSCRAWRACTTGEQKGTRYWLPVATAPIDPVDIADLAGVGRLGLPAMTAWVRSAPLAGRGLPVTIGLGDRRAAATDRPEQDRGHDGAPDRHTPQIGEDTDRYRPLPRAETAGAIG